MLKNIRFLILLLLLAGVLSSCQTLPTRPGPPPAPVYVPRSTIYHTVAPGETLWRIGKIYDVPIASIMRTNRLTNQSKLEMGQRLQIAGAKEPVQPISLFPSNKWKYIIVHHTATESGSSLAFHKAHLLRGWDAIGYHFVINNGSGEKHDGFIEVTPRWLKQMDGAHCKASDMNTKAIGISLVGNFDEDRVSPAQMKSLVDLVNTLRKYYHIPLKNILGHGQVGGSNTDCPGTQFPWYEFKSKL